MPEAAAERWMAAKAAFTAALEHPPADRRRIVEAACGNDETLIREVESLLEAHESAGDFLAGSARDELDADIAQHAGLAPGDRLGAYRVLHEIARGGMGTVYLAERADAEFEQRVAIKLVTRGMDTEMVLRRFRRERQILAELQHPNIARLLEGGTTADGLPYFVMEYIEGEHIDCYCDSRNLSVDARLDLFRDVCAAVQYAHQRLVVHRDIKPANVLVTRDGAPKLLDFGIARLLTPSLERPDLTAAPFRVMTPEYASPEQLDGAAVTTLSDVYSLGVVLYEMLTGRRAHAPGKRRATGDADLSGPIAPSSSVRALRGDIDTIILCAMRREPERRYASAQALSDDILRYRRGLPVAARTDSWSYRAIKFVRRNRAAIALGSLAIVALIGGSAAFAWQAHVAKQEQAVAEHRSGTVRRLALSLLFDVHDAIVDLPGSTRARQLILTRALESLDSLARDDTTDPRLQRDVAAAYLRVGDVQGEPYSANLGQTTAALVSYERAARLLTPIVVASPRDTVARHALANALFKTAAIHMRAGEWPNAEASVRRAIAVIDTGLVYIPRDTAAQALLVRSLMYLGDALGAGGDRRSVSQIDAARDAYTRALRVELDVANHVGRSPGVLASLSHAYTRLGYVGSWTAEATGDTTQLALSVTNHRIAQRLRHEIFAFDSSSSARRTLADGWMDIANTEMPLGHFRAALALLDSAGPIFVSLARADTANVEARRDLAFYAENRGVVLVGLGRFAESVAEERTAIPRLTALQRADRGSVEEYYHLVHAQEVLGDALARRGATAAALAAYADARATIARWKRAAPGVDQPARLERELESRTEAIGLHGSENERRDR